MTEFDSEVRVVQRDERTAATGLPAGSSGEEAFRDPAGWVGFIELDPGSASGWHHHGDWDSYAYVLSGVLRWEFGTDGRDAVEVRPGGVARMPARLVHRDVSAGADRLSIVLFRTGQGELTIDVPGPSATGASAKSG